MNEQTPDKSIKDNVLNAIESGKVKMRPKWKFVTRTAFIVFGIILLVLAALYVASLITFMLRANGIWNAFGFGGFGFIILLRSLPWLLVLVAVIFILLLQVMIQRYSFAYGRPLLFSAIVILGLVVVGGIVLDQTRIHDPLVRRGSRPRFDEPFFRQFNRPPENLSFGIITKQTGSRLTIDDIRRGEMVVTITPQTQLPDQSLKVGDKVVVLGQRDDKTIKAESIRIIGQLPPARRDDDRRMPPPGMMPLR